MDHAPPSRHLRISKQVLVVEDNADFGELIVESLETMDPKWNPILVGTGQEALDCLRRAKWMPGLVLVDLGLPDMSGLEVIRAARLRDAELPILVISVLSDNASVLEAIRAGALGYLQKGDNVLSITSAIEKVLDGESPISSSLASHLFQLVKTGSPSLGDVGQRLSIKELELLKLLSRGFTYSESAERMGLAHSSAQTMVKRIYKKLQVDSKIKAINKASEHGWL